MTKRFKTPTKWRTKDEECPEEDSSFDDAELEGDISDLVALLKELLEECRKLNGSLTQLQPLLTPQPIKLITSPPQVQQMELEKTKR